MGKTIEVDSRSLPLIIRRTVRKKSIGIELTPRHEVIVRAPRSLSEAAISEGLNKCLPWLRRKLSQLPPASAAQYPVSGAELLVLGATKRLAVESDTGPEARVKESAATLTVFLSRRNGPAEGPSIEAVRSVLVSWYRTKAAAVINELVIHHSRAMGIAAPHFSVTGARRRWGSCGTNGRLNFAWRLAMAPPDLVEYVVVHELCHLRRRDHSPAFWALVAALLPDYRQRRRRLHEQGILYDL